MQNSLWTYTYFFVICSIQEALEVSVHSQQSPMSTVGHFLDRLMEMPDLANCGLPKRISDSVQQPIQAGGILHTVIKYTQSNQIMLIIELIRGVPESFDIFHCCPCTTEEELKLFMKRVEFYPRQYILLEVNRLTYHLQEVNSHILGAIACIMGIPNILC